MALTPKSFEEIYLDYQNEAQARQELLTDWNDGSINDVLAGSTVTGVQEIIRILQDRFKLTFFSSSEGTDLEFLAKDHYGDSFARPGATSAITIVEFSRTSLAAGNVNIDEGTIVKTQPDSNGQTFRFEVILGVTMTGLTISASVRAIEAGPDSNVGSNKITVIETALTDPSITVTNASAAVGGKEQEEDAEYRETIIRLITTLTGATCAAIKAAASEVAGVENVTIIEFVTNVIEWDDATQMPIGDSFKIARARVYIADANGSASQALIDTVDLALETIRACGVHVEILGATALSLDWSASFSLNPSGPNYATLQTDPALIEASMTQYIQDLATGANFNRAIARQYILGIWGPSGTDDLTDFTNNSPSGDVDTTEIQKLIPGTIEVV